MEFQDFLLELKVLSEETFRTEVDFLLNGSNRGSETERKIHALAIGYLILFLLKFVKVIYFLNF